LCLAVLPLSADAKLYQARLMHTRIYTVAKAVLKPEQFL